MTDTPPWEADKRHDGPQSGAYNAALERDLVGTLARGEIGVVYQPQYAASDGAVVGAEALARWQHPEWGAIGAGRLVAIAQHSGHAGLLSRHVLKTALADARDWPRDLRLSVNVTPADLATRPFAATIAYAMHELEFPAERLTLEITEQTPMREFERSAEALARLVGAGIRIALDDFGAGFCNFRYLKALPLHYLKLDRSMIEGIGEDSRDLAILRGILAMADALGLEVVAEGVEREVQRAIVTAEGCTSWQGFLGSEPLSAEDFRALARGETIGR